VSKKDYYKRHLCPVCGKYEFESHGSFDLCEECGWQDDPMQESEETDEGGANPEGLRFARILYKAGKSKLNLKEKYRWLIENGYDEKNEIDREYVYENE